MRTDNATGGTLSAMHPNPWTPLMDAQASEARQAITTPHFAQAAHRFITQLNRLVQEELYRLVVEAQKAADHFWAEQRYQRLQKEGKTGRFGTRIRLIRHSLQAVWYRNRFVDKRLYSTYLPKGTRTKRYPARAFARATED